MSGPGSSADGYRCDACRRRKNRCADCRAARAAARRELHARKRVEGICLQCSEPAEVGRLCAAHNAYANRVSGESHARARAKRSGKRP